MRLYYDMWEKVERDPEFIRCDITGKSDSEKADVQAAMEDIMSGKSYRILEHLCGHDEMKLCTMELIKEV